jgi:hypothetical protein
MLRFDSEQTRPCQSGLATAFTDRHGIAIPNHPRPSENAVADLDGSTAIAV